MVQADTTERPEFHTKNGRTVYGGGGITPDIVIERNYDPTTTNMALNANRIFFEFGSEYVSSHQEIEQMSFQDFAGQYEIDSEAIDQLKEFARSREIEIDEEEFAEDLADIKNNLKSKIASNIWGKDEMYAVRLMTDTQVQEALRYFPEAKELAAVE